jgi:putative Mg2+ transporter-C (MgtC) family protein
LIYVLQTNCGIKILFLFWNFPSFFLLALFGGKKMTGSLTLVSLTIEEAFLRVVIAVMAGLVIGLDRDLKNKPVNFRAYMIVAGTACAVAILSAELALREDMTIDIGKSIAGVMTGIGFLGAGAIIHRSGTNVVGTATGASIWAAGGIGLTAGFGIYGLFLTFSVAVAAILIISGLLMPHLSGEDDREQEK